MIAFQFIYTVRTPIDNFVVKMNDVSRLLLFTAACSIQFQDSYCHPTRRNTWRENGSPAAIAGPPAPEGPDSPSNARSQAMTRPSRPGEGGAPGGRQLGTMMQNMMLMPATHEERGLDVSGSGAPAHVKPPGTPKYVKRGPPGAPLSMVLDDDGAHPPGPPRGSGWRPGPSIEFAEMWEREPDPAADIRNMTIDQVIVKAYGGLNKSLEAPTDPENAGKIVAELDMVLTPQQYRALYGENPAGHRDNTSARTHGRPSAPSGPGSQSAAQAGHQAENMGPAQPGDQAENMGPARPGDHSNLGPAPPSHSNHERS